MVINCIPWLIMVRGDRKGTDRLHERNRLVFNKNTTEPKESLDVIIKENLQGSGERQQSRRN